MITSLFRNTRAFLQKYNAQIYIPLLLLILSTMSLLILRKPAAGDILVAEWGTKYLLPAVVLLSVLLSVLKRYFISLSIFIGYHAGLLLAVLGTDAGIEQLGYGKATVILTLLIFFTVGLWGEILIHFLSRKRKLTPSEENTE